MTSADGQSIRSLMVIDTDGGGDDAVALLAALDQRSTCQVLAITIVHGNVEVDQATDNVLRILNFTGRTDIPVYKGCHRAIMKDFSRDYEFHGHDGISGSSKKYPLPAGCGPKLETAVHALMRLATENRKQMTLVCLGPLTNVAFAHRLDRNFSDNLKELLIMGGNMEGRGNATIGSEFNFQSDCEAADIVLHEFHCLNTLVTYEVCDDFKKSWEWFDRWTSKGTKRSEFVGDVLAAPVACSKSRQSSGFHCCDLLAMTAFVHPSVVLQSTDCNARVELRGDHTRGMMVIERPLWEAKRQQSSERPFNVRLHTVFDEEAVTKIWDKLTD